MSATASDISLDSNEVDGIKIIATRTEGMDASSLRETADQLRKKEKNTLVVLISTYEDKAPIVVATHKDLERIDARKVMEYVVNLLGGSGGGRPDFAQGGIENFEEIDNCLVSLPEYIVSLNS